MTHQNWIYKPRFDILFILSPPFLCLLIIILFSSYFNNHDVSWPWWLALVLCVDVGHVYSTIYRTYADKETFKTHRLFLISLPVVLFVFSVLVYQAGSIYFWRLLAYIAVFHFIRQQYGFMRIYTRGETSGPVSRWIDVITIYAATLYPVLFWHIRGDRQFHWFVDHDFLDLSALKEGLPFLKGLYGLILLSYVTKEVVMWLRYKRFNIPKQLLVAGTVVSWYAGIVYYNGDLIFTLMNVVSHGIPYIALVWVYGHKKSGQSTPVYYRIQAWIFKKKYILLFIGSLFMMAYAEEYLWDLFIWHEHSEIFPGLHLSEKTLKVFTESLIIPLLSVPQLTHYVIDGFIWKIQKDRFNWKSSTLNH
ncbi:MAG: hypothetical protein JST26_13595 [Bacteroidetes bacterium]|nr:hypothetical protein [Bacteroidota bacterium]